MLTVHGSDVLTKHVTGVIAILTLLNAFGLPQDGVEAGPLSIEDQGATISSR